MKLVLGTAEFNPAGYNGEQAPALSEIKRIFALAKEGGISIIDTAESYNCYDIIRKEAKGFCIYTKTRNWVVPLDWGDNELRGILYHYQQGETQIELPFVHRWVNMGVSIYDTFQLPENKLRILQIPLNIIHKQFTGVFSDYRTVFVRSVFARGNLLSKYTIKECLDYVDQFRPDGIIVGVKTVRELEEILKCQ